MSAQFLLAADRPLRLQLRADLSLHRLEFSDGEGWVAYDPIALVYHRLEPIQQAILELLDGRRCLNDLKDAIAARFPGQAWSASAVQSLVADLHKKGLTISLTAGQGTVLDGRRREQIRKHWLSAWKQILYLRLPGWNPDGPLLRLLPWVRWIYTPWLLVLLLAAVAFAWLLPLVYFDEFRQRLPEFEQFFGWPNLLWLWGTLVVTKLVHEFGHGLTCRYFGAACHEMGVMLLVFSPTMYCDVSDSWRLPSKWARIAIAAAGMGFELLLSGLALVTWWLTQPGLLHYLSLNVFFVTTLTTVVFNANPLLRYDGYYMLSDWLGIPNLRPKADRLIQHQFARWCLGIEMPPAPFEPQRGRVWFAAFAVASTIYGWIVWGGILLFLYTWLKPHGLQSFGMTLAVASLLGVVISLVQKVWTIVTTPRSTPLKGLRLAAFGVLLLVAIGVVLLIPVPWFIEAPVLVEPADLRNVHAVVPGRLVKVRVAPGDRVQVGEPLLVLENEELSDQLLKLDRELSAQFVELQTLRALGLVGEEAVALERLVSLQDQLRVLHAQHEELTVRAPMTGRVVVPPRVPEPRFDPDQKVLPRWFGTPIDRRNVGAFFEAGTHLLTIAPDDRWQAVLYLSQSHRNDVSPGAEVRLRLDHLPHRTWRSTVGSIAAEQENYAPPALSAKSGGNLATTTDAEQRERLVDVAYRVLTPIGEGHGLLRTGVRGRARINVEHRTIGGWLLRWFRTTLHFRL